MHPKEKNRVAKQRAHSFTLKSKQLWRGPLGQQLKAKHLGLKFDTVTDVLCVLQCVCAWQCVLV